MRWLQRGLFVAALTLGTASAGFAQSTSSGSSGGSTGSSGSSGGSGGGGGSGGSSSGGSTITATIPSTPTISSTTNGGISKGSLDSSNILGGYYANALYQGARSDSGDQTTVVNPGGFGQTTFTAGGSASISGTSRALGGSTTTSRAGAAGGVGGGATGGGLTAGRSTGLGGTSGFGTAGGVSGQSSAQQLTTGRNIAYTQALRFGVAPPTAPQLQADVRAVIDTTSAAPNARNVAVAATPNGLVVLTGTVYDGEEARLIEGVVLLTPGVKQVRNELRAQNP